MILPTNMSAIRSLSSRIDSLVDQTNRVANGFELNSHLPIPSQQQNKYFRMEWIIITSKILVFQFLMNRSNFTFVFSNLLSSRPQSALQSPFLSFNSN